MKHKRDVSPPLAAPSSRDAVSSVPVRGAQELLPLPVAWLYALIFVVSLLAYIPALKGDFIWDDAGHVTRDDLQSLDGLRRIWFEPGATQQYYPVLHTAFWLEHHVLGDAPGGYHLLNVLLHALAACLVAKLLRRLEVPGAGLAALLFALHPVCVESVAWISEQKNTLSAVFYLAASLAYLRFDEGRQPRWYALATVRFVLALLAKTVTATLPAALLVICWWRRGRLDWRRDVVPLLPWFALSLAAGLLTSWVERTQIGAHGDDFSLTLIQRLLLAGHVVWFYFGKLLWPLDLIFIYPRWTIDAGDAAWWLSLIAALAAIGGLMWWRLKKQSRGPLAFALLFGGTLFPALGFFNVYPFLYSFVADHFQYLASVSVLAALAWVLTVVVPRWSHTLARAAALVVLLAFGGLTWAQSATYRDVFTLYETTIARNPGCWMAHNNLAEALAGAGRVPDAIPHLERALQLRPNFAEAENNLGYDLTLVGRLDEGITHLQRAIQLQPAFAEAHNNLGGAFMRAGRASEGIAEFERALQLKPAYAVARFNHGLALASSGHPAEAIPDFTAALKLNPRYAEAELNWAIALTVTEHVIQAIPHFEHALQLNPDSADAHTTYARALLTIGRYDAAVAHCRQAIELNPASADAHYQLASALRGMGRLDEAQQELVEASRLGDAH